MSSELIKLSYQKEHRPKAEDVIPLILTDAAQQTALDFVSWMRENKMSPGWAGYHNAWNSNCKGKNICKIELGKNEGKNGWSITLVLRHFDKYEGIIIEEGMQELIWSMLKKCIHHHKKGECEAKCRTKNRDLSRTVLGKYFDELCRDSNVTRFRISMGSPNDETVVKIKKLILLEQNARKSI